MTMKPSTYTQTRRIGKTDITFGAVKSRALSSATLIESEAVEIPAFTLENIGGGLNCAWITTTVYSETHPEIRLAPSLFTLLLFQGSLIDMTKAIGISATYPPGASVLRILPPQPLPENATISGGSDGNNAVYLTRISHGSIGSQTVCGLVQARVFLPIGGKVAISNEVRRYSNNTL